MTMTYAVNASRMTLIAAYSFCFFWDPGMLPDALDNYLLTIIAICAVFPFSEIRK